MDSTTNFIVLAEDLLDRIARIVQEKDINIIATSIIPICQNFNIFYTEYFEDSELSEEELSIHQQNFNNLINSLNNNIIPYQRFRQVRSIKKIRMSNALKARYLQSLLIGLRTIFLKTLGYDFVQQIVIEMENGQPMIIQPTDYTGLANFIRSQTKDLQGKLQSNIKMLETYRRNSDLYDKIQIEQKYLDVYAQTRRRLNIFYSRVGRTPGGEALLLYRPQTVWIKFYVNNLGDVKQGFVSMVAHQASLGSGIEGNVQTFAETYIGSVDNMIATLLQDIVIEIGQIKQQISVKSGSGRTGSHVQLIKLIQNIASSNPSSVLGLISGAFSKDQAKMTDNSKYGQRNKILQDGNENHQKKLASLLESGSKKTALKALQETISSTGVSVS